MQKIKRVSDTIAKSYRLRICHVSDTHKEFPQLIGRFDVVVHSGDFFPDFYIPSGNQNQLPELQLNWLQENIVLIKRWLKGSPLLFILGNHDFVSPDIVEKTLKDHDIDATSLHDEVITYQEVKFYGFPYVPTIDGTFNYERRDVPEMFHEISNMIQKLSETYVDVLVAHAPPYQVLDLTIENKNVGNSNLANIFIDKRYKNILPEYLLVGHIHEASGVTIWNNTLVSNAAFSKNIIEVI